MKLRATLGALMLVCAAAPPVLASGGFVFKEHGFYIIDFVVLFALLFWVIRKPAKQFLLDRYASIAAEIESSTKLKDEASQRYERYHTLLDDVDEEIGRIQERFRDDGEKAKAKILRGAADSTEKMRQAAVRQREQAEAAAFEDLAREVAVRSVELAEQKVVARVDDKTQRALVASYIDELEQMESLTSV